MIRNRPEFHLTSVYEDGARDEPQIVPVTALPWETAMSRRGALGVGLGIAGVLSILSDVFAQEPQGPTSKPAFIPPTEIMACKVPTAALKAHDQGVNTLALTSDGNFLISSGNHSDVKIWDMASGKLQKKFETVKPADGNHRYHLAVTPSGEILSSWFAIGINTTIQFYSLPDGKPISQIIGNLVDLRSLAISPDGTILAVAGLAWGQVDFSVELWSLPEGKPLGAIRTSERGSQLLTFTPDSNNLIISNDNGPLSFFSVKEHRFLSGANNTNAYASTLLVLPDGQACISGHMDGAVYVWAVPDGKLLRALRSPSTYGYGHDVKALAITSDASVLVTGGADGVIRCWSLPDGQLIREVTLKLSEYEMRSIVALTFTRDGKTLISADDHGQIILWDFPSTPPGVPCFRSYLFDSAATPSGTKAIAYNLYDRVTGRTITYTLPCGSPIPPGATCTCNCVPGTSAPSVPQVPYAPPTTDTICSCNKVCTCVPVPTFLR